MVAVFATRPEVPFRPSYSPSVSSHSLACEAQSKDRPPSSSSVQQPKGSRQSWASDTASSNRQSTSSATTTPVFKDKGPLGDSSFDRDQVAAGDRSISSRSNSSSNLKRRPLETSLAVNMGRETGEDVSIGISHHGQGKTVNADQTQMPSESGARKLPIHQAWTAPQRPDSASQAHQSTRHTAISSQEQNTSSQHSASQTAKKSPSFQDSAASGSQTKQGVHPAVTSVDNGPYATLAPANTNYPTGPGGSLGIQHPSDPSSQSPHEQPRSASASSSNGPSIANSGFHPYRRHPSKQNISKERDRVFEGAIPTPTPIADSKHVEPSDEVLQDPSATGHKVVSIPRASFEKGNRAKLRTSASVDAAPSATMSTHVNSRAAPGRNDLSGNGNPQTNYTVPAAPFAFVDNGGISLDNGNPRRNMHRRNNSSTSSVGEVIAPTLMQSGSSAAAHASNASQSSNGLNPGAQEWRPSFSKPQTDHSHSPGRSVSDTLPRSDVKKEKGGLRGKLQKAIRGEADTTRVAGKTQSARPVINTAQGQAAAMHQPNDSLGSSTTHSTDPPVTPPEPTPGLGHRRPSNSSFAPSFIEPLDGARGKPKRSLFSMRNASTDNISISSTVSSASLMIRKMGAIGKLARRNSLAGISKIFKDKTTEDGEVVDEPGTGPKKEKKKMFRFGSKAQATTATNTEDSALDGLTPAAQLARQHTLKSKKEGREKGRSTGPTPLKNGDENVLQVAAPREAGGPEDGDSDDNLGDVGDSSHLQMESLDIGAENRASYDESREWEEHGLPWGQGYVDRDAIPARGILKANSSYNGSDKIVQHHAAWARTRSDSADISGQEPGPLAHLTHQTEIDGVKSNDVMDPFSPTFDPFAAADNKTRRQDHVVYNNASLNSSAPMLSLAQDPGLTQRSVTSPMPKKRLNWAPECAIYHTFHATEYDRRSEPATCNRLTPSLAQEIKDELNGYKMEEMAVHPSSRVHTHFFI